jgi:hypothetical protein
MDIPNFTDRTFKLWLYTVSHGQLLIRSTKDSKRGTQVDVLFKEVVALCLPAFFEGLTVRKGGVGELDRTYLGGIDVSGKTLFHVNGNGWNGWVVAAAVAWVEEDAEYYPASKLIADFSPENVDR